MSDELQKQLAVLKENYLLALPSKIDDIRETWLSASSTGQLDSLIELHRKAHSLAGSGATFDQFELSKVAKTLENFIKDHMVNSEIFTESNAIAVNVFINKLENSFDLRATKGSSDIPKKEDDLISIGLNVDKMRILIADDDDDNRNRLDIILRSAGHEVYIACDGNEAVKLALLNMPDLILMDVIMPNMTGYDAARKIKEQISEKFIPILFLTAVTDNESLAGCISAGGDDFINKPVHPLILNAKLAAFQRISQMYEKLDEYQRKNEIEMEASKEVLDSVIYQNDQDIKGLQVWAKSPGHFSGDTRLYREMDNGHIYVLLCDFTGHGLPAAIGTVFVSDLFRSMTSKNIPALYILNEINTKMNQILPTGRYCAAIMMDYCPSDNKVTLWNCGLPDVYLTDKNRKIVADYPSQNVPLGVLSGGITTDPYEIDTNNISEVIIFSDGITEAEDPSGNMYGDEKLIELIESSSSEKDLFTEIKTDVEGFMNGEDPSDDISLVVFKF
ncbi:MAG: SpoIIE family protein phosphatase [Gammaproteobacteria bacterium]|nr:SpoIIE family protein phosphatase [Gammaproteobacteria bacterium]